MVEFPFIFSIQPIAVYWYYYEGLFLLSIAKCVNFNYSSRKYLGGEYLIYVVDI